MIYVNYNTGRRFIERIGDQCSILTTIDDWEKVCGSYCLDLERNYIFLHAIGNEIYIEYKGGTYPIKECTCSFYKVEKPQPSRSFVFEIWSIQVEHKDKIFSILFEGDVFINMKTTLESDIMNFGQYIMWLKNDAEAREWYISNHSNTNAPTEFYLHSYCSEVGPVIKYDGQQIHQLEKASVDCTMYDGQYYTDIEGEKCFLYLENDKFIFQYKDIKVSLDDPNLSLDYEPLLPDRDIYKLTIGIGNDIQSMSYECLLPDIWGEDDEWDLNWGCYLSIMANDGEYRKKSLDRIMHLRKR